MNTAGGIADGHAGSNGVTNSALYAKKHSYPWVDVGQLKEYTKIRNEYPHAKYEYGMSYNGHLRPAFFNGWNRGTRVSLLPIYPQNDSPQNLIFATTVWSINVDGAAADTWWHRWVSLWVPN